MPANFSYVLPGKLAGMEFPGSFESVDADLAFLRREGVGAVVSLTPKRLDPDELALHELAGLHLPIPDFTAPTQAQIDRFVRFVDEQVAAGRAVVAHCGAGQGRTGTMLACYLVREGWTPDDA
ncbi:MAG: fused DSP-PTPase phosphatase/NAD kinase-like protein, partial [Planctomycetota bacterium]